MPSEQTRLTSFSPRWGLAGLILLHAGLLTWSALTNSVAFDEYAHLPAGVSYWQHREFGMLNLTPPLLRLWAAAPVVAAGIEAPALEPFRDQIQKDRYWNYGDAFLRGNAPRYQQLFELARLGMIPISCFGAWVVYRWAATLYGSRCALLSGAAYVLCPNLCAHASLVGTDAGIAVAVVTAAWLWWRYCRLGSRTALALATLAVGAAHLSKFTALLLWPVMIAIALCVMGEDVRRLWRRMAGGLAAVAVGSLLLFNLGYGLEGTGKRVATYELRSKSLSSVFARLPAGLPVPLPDQAVLGFDSLKWKIEQQFPGFLLGQQYTGSRWYYFPVALAVKLPVATLVLLALAAATKRRSRDELCVFCALGIFLLGMMFFAGANLGVRYVLPVLPFAFILIGRAGSKPRWMLGVLVAALLIENLSVAPRYLTFFNVLAGGPSRGQYLLNDSNYDWGQGLLDLKKWMNDTRVRRVHLAYFGRVDPSVYGIDYDLVTEVSGQPYVAISSYFLVGLPHRLPSRHGSTGFVQLPFYRQLQSKPRVAIPGGTIHVFRREDVGLAMQEYEFARQSVR